MKLYTCYCIINKVVLCLSFVIMVSYGNCKSHIPYKYLHDHIKKKYSQTTAEILLTLMYFIIIAGFIANLITFITAIAGKIELYIPYWILLSLCFTPLITSVVIIEYVFYTIIICISFVCSECYKMAVMCSLCLEEICCGIKNADLMTDVGNLCDCIFYECDIERQNNKFVNFIKNKYSFPTARWIIVVLYFMLYISTIAGGLLMIIANHQNEKSARIMIYIGISLLTPVICIIIGTVASALYNIKHCDTCGSQCKCCNAITTCIKEICCNNGYNYINENNLQIDNLEKVDDLVITRDNLPILHQVIV